MVHLTNRGKYIAENSELLELSKVKSIVRLYKLNGCTESKLRFMSRNTIIGTNKSALRKRNSKNYRANYRQLSRTNPLVNVFRDLLVIDKYKK